MPTITSCTKPIMLITGLLTSTMIYALLFPGAALESMFGNSLGDTALAHIVVSSWGALITLIGGMLIYGAFRPQLRPLILTIAGLSKLIFVGLLLLLGSQYLPYTLTTIAVDSIAILLFVVCLPTAHRDARHG